MKRRRDPSSNRSTEPRMNTASATHRKSGVADIVLLSVDGIVLQQSDADNRARRIANDGIGMSAQPGAGTGVTASDYQKVSSYARCDTRYRAGCFPEFEMQLCLYAELRHVSDELFASHVAEAVTPVLIRYRCQRVYHN